MEATPQQRTAALEMGDKIIEFSSEFGLGMEWAVTLIEQARQEALEKTGIDIVKL